MVASINLSIKTQLYGKKLKPNLLKFCHGHENYQNNKIFKRHKSTMMKVDLILNLNHGIQKLKTRT